MSEDKEESIFSKAKVFFQNKVDVKEKKDETQKNKEGTFEGFRAKFLSEKDGDKELRNRDLEGIEQYTEKNEQSLGNKGIIDVLSDTFNSTIDALKDTTGSSFDSVKMVATDSLSFTTDKLDLAKQSTLEFSSSTTDSLVHFTKDIGRKYDEMEISPRFYSLINTVDLVLVISSLQALIEKQRKGSKEFIALSIIISLLMLLNRSKDEMKKEMGFIEINEELNHDLTDLLKSVTFKEVVETAEPILLVIPNGNYILLILKLFV